MLMSDTDDADFAYEFLLSFIYDVSESPGWKRWDSETVI